jgi:hypothetical protein
MEKERKRNGRDKEERNVNVEQKSKPFKTLYFIRDAYAMKINIFKADGEAICMMSPYVTANTKAVRTAV